MPGDFLRSLAFLLLLNPALGIGQSATSQNSSQDDLVLAQVRQLTASSNWEGILCLVPSAEVSPELCFYRGLALSRLQQWEQARQSFEMGGKNARSDPRFPREMAGALFQLRRAPEAKKALRRALKLDGQDAYTQEFLATLYFMEDNLEAALKYWNPSRKPAIEQITSDPQPRLNPAILDQAFAVAPASMLGLAEFRNTQASLDQLEIFPSYRFELQPRTDGKFDLLFRPVEKNGWGKKAERILSIVRGIPSLTLRVDLFNLWQEAVNLESRVRFDAQKRRVFSQFSAPLGGHPSWRGKFYVDGRKENWDLSRSYQQDAPLPGDLRLQRLAAGGVLSNRLNWEWEWQSGFELSYRDFRNLPSVSSSVSGLFKPGVALKYLAGVERKLWSIPERRFMLQSSAAFEAGKLFRGGTERFSKLQGTLEASWFPQAKGDDYLVTASFFGGRADGSVPFDELFILGLERDNELWLRGHVATENRKRGAGFLGQDYLLVNWEIEKRIYQNSIFDLRVGPAIDTGRIYDKHRNFGSQMWLTDLGLLLKARFPSGITIILSYGKDLQTGRNGFYATTSR